MALYHLITFCGMCLAIFYLPQYWVFFRFSHQPMVHIVYCTMFHSKCIFMNTIWRPLLADPTWKIRYVLNRTIYSHDESTSSPTKQQKRIGIHKVSEENTRHDRSFALNNATIDGWSVGWSGQRGRLCKARPPSGYALVMAMYLGPLHNG